MKWEELRPKVVLGATILALIGVGVGRYRFVTKLPGVRALAHAAPERMLYYKVDAAHEPAFLLDGAARSFRLVTHQLIGQPGEGETYDPAKSYPYALHLKVIDPQGAQLWQTTLREDSRQSKVLGKDGAWTDETAYLEGRAQPVSDPRTSIVELPTAVPAGSLLVVAPADPRGPALLLRAYALAGSGRQELHARLARNPQIKLEGLSYLRAQDLVPAESEVELGDPAQRMIAQDDSKGQAQVLPIFVRKARRGALASILSARRWIAGPWDRALLAKGPGALEAELLYEKADADAPCPEGELIVEQIDFENKRQNRRYDLALRSQSMASPRRCLSGRVEFELGLELRDVRLRWKPRAGTPVQARMQVRLWAKDAPISLLSRAGWTNVEPYEEIQEVSTLRIETERLGASPDQRLVYDVTPGKGANRELDLSIRRTGKPGAASTELGPGELSWTFLDGKGKRVGSGKLDLEAPFDPASWGHPKDSRSAAPTELAPLPLVLSLPDRTRIKVPRRAQVFELSASVPSVAKVSARLRPSSAPAPLDPVFAQIPLGKMKWILAPRVTRNWSSLRAQGLGTSQLVDIESQLHLELRQPSDKKETLAVWRTLEPQGRSTRQEVLEQSPLAQCASCWYELASDTEYLVRGSASLRRGAKVLMDMGAPANSTQLASCGIEIDGEAASYRCPIFRATQALPELGAGKHRVSWSKGAPGARLWVNQRAVSNKRKAPTRSYKRRTLHELGPGEALALAWKKAKGKASRVHVDVYLPQDPGQTSSPVLEAQLQRRGTPWTSQEQASVATLRGKRIERDTELRFLNDTHSGEFAVYRFVIDVGAHRSAGSYALDFTPNAQGKLWIRAINRM